MITRRALLTAATGWGLGGAAAARIHRVQMLNRGPGGAMVFDPAFLRAELGDLVRFVPTDPGHNAEVIVGLAPTGTPPTRGAMGAVFDLRLERPGLYGVKCAPHFGMGMVALIAVGDVRASRPGFEAGVARLPGLARRRMTEALARLG